MESGDGFSYERDDYETLISTTDVELLKSAWRNEKAAPEILRFESDLVRRSTEQIKLMEETVEIFAKSGIDPLTVSLYQMDVDRTLFLLRSYLRIRLQKIEKYVFHIYKTDLFNRLSRKEREFALRCKENLEEHLKQSALSKLPDNYQSIEKQSITSDEDDMVPKPQLDTFVVCKSKEYVDRIQLEDSENLPSSSDIPLNMEPDVLYFIRYKPIKKFLEERLENRKIDLI